MYEVLDMLENMGNMCSTIFVLVRKYCMHTTLVIYRFYPTMLIKS